MEIIDNVIKKREFYKIKNKNNYFLLQNLFKMVKKIYFNFK